MVEVDTDLVNYIFDEIKKGKSKEEIYNFLIHDNSLDIKEEDFNRAHLVAKNKLDLLKSFIKDTNIPQKTDSSSPIQSSPTSNQINNNTIPQDQNVNSISSQPNSKLPYSSITYTQDYKPANEINSTQDISAQKYNPNLSTSNSNEVQPKKSRNTIKFLIIGIVIIILLGLIAFFVLPLLDINFNLAELI